LSVGDAIGVEVGVGTGAVVAGTGEDGEGGNAAGGAGDETDCRVCAAAVPVCLTGRVSPDDFAFAGRERLARLTGGGGGGAASGVLAGVAL
jgi:hypothetical protein